MKRFFSIVAKSDLIEVMISGALDSSALTNFISTNKVPAGLNSPSRAP